MIGKLLRKAIIVIISTLIISLLCPVNVMAAENNHQNASTVQLNKEYSGSLSESKNFQWYKFTLPEAGTVTISTKADKVIVYSLLYGDDAKNEIFYDSPVWNKDDNAFIMNFTYNLKGGTYYFIVMEKYVVDANYKFSVNFTDLNESITETYEKNNNKFEAASSIYLNTQYTGCIAINDGIDYFRFNVPVDTTVTINTFSYVNSLYYYLYDSSKNKITQQSSSASEISANVIKQKLKKGTYYLAVKGPGDHYGIYTFTISSKDIPNLSITTHPKDYIGSAGSRATFRVAAQGTGLSYQWQYYSGGKWNNFGSNNPTVSLTVSNTHNGMKYRCIVKDLTGKTVTSNVATVKIVKPLSITTHPKDYTGPVGSKVTFSVVAQGTGLSYQWQYYSGGAWKNFGTNKSTVSLTVSNSHNGMKYRCIVKDLSGKSVTSNVATIKILTTQALSITTHPKDYTGPAGSKVTFSVVAQGTGISYQWQYYSGGTWKIFGTNKSTASLTVSNSHNGMKYRCVVKDSSGKTVTSNVATIKIKN